MRISNLFKFISLGTIWLWLLIFALIPNILVIAASFMRRGEDQFIAVGFTLANYWRLFDPLYLQVLRDSLYLAGLTTVLCLLVGYPFAYVLTRMPLRLRPILLLLVIIPFWTSSLVRTYAIIIILRTRGILNEWLLALGIIDAPLQILYTETAVLIGLVYALLPFMVLPLYAAIDKLDWRLVEAAQDLGAGPMRIFLKIILPLTLPGILAGSLLVSLPALGMFYIPDLLGGARSLLVGNLIRDQFLTARDWPFGAAASTMLTLLMGLMLWIYYLSASRIQRRGLP